MEEMMESTTLDSALELARRVESTAVSVFERHFQPVTQADILIFTMAVRCLGLFQGAIRCANDDLADAAMVATRALLEQRFSLCAIARSADEAERAERLAALKADAENAKGKAIEKLKRLPHSKRSARVTDQLLAAAEAGLSNDWKNKKKLVEEWAKWAGLHDHYLSAYASLSLHVHPSYLTLDAMTSRSAEGELLVSAKPHRGALPRTVVFATESMVDALASLPDIHVSSEAVAFIARHRQALDVQWKGMPEEDLGDKFNGVAAL
jgi:Family of unknown function (DUF5677)